MKLKLLVGPPGSGKSTLANSLIYEDGDHGLATVYINQDTQGKDHIVRFTDAITDSKDIIVDRMNFNKVQRERYLKPAREAGYETEIIVLHQTRKECYERIVKRENHPTIKDAISANSALNTFFSKYEKPIKDEADKISFIYEENKSKDLAVIIDLDGTLCNIDHRLHHVRGEGKKNWKAFFDELSKDEPNGWCAAIVEQMSCFTIVFASGRPDDYEEATRFWLKEHGFPTTHLYMRCRGDHRQDYVAKEIILDFEILSRFKPLFFLDDRKQVVDLWRSRGFVCLHCAEGDF